MFGNNTTWFGCCALTGWWAMGSTLHLGLWFLVIEVYHAHSKIMPLIKTI